jgi:hypothetical protein
VIGGIDDHGRKVLLVHTVEELPQVNAVIARIDPSLASPVAEVEAIVRNAARGSEMSALCGDNKAVGEMRREAICHRPQPRQRITHGSHPPNQYRATGDAGATIA